MNWVHALGLGLLLGALLIIWAQARAENRRAEKAEASEAMQGAVDRVNAERAETQEEWEARWQRGSNQAPRRPVNTDTAAPVSVIEVPGGGGGLLGEVQAELLKQRAAEKERGR